MPTGPAPKGPRLWLEPERARKGRSPTRAHWTIRDDGGFKRSLDFGPHERSGAEKALENYLAEKHRIAPGECDPAQRLTADVISLYAQDIAGGHARPEESAARLTRLLTWWAQPAAAMRLMREWKIKADQMTGHLSDISNATCTAYVHFVGATRSASMDLEMLRAAINHAMRERKLDRPVTVTLPEKSLPRDRWLTRPEMAALIWAAWRSRRKGNGLAKDDGPDGWANRQHLARFLVIGRYTGTRKTATLLGAFERLPGHGYIDLDEGVWYRQPAGKRRTKKRQPPQPIPLPLLAHMRRWKKNGQRFAVEFNGQPVQRVDKAYRQLVKDIGLGADVVIHTVRHTAITWGMQNGMEPFDASGYFGISLQVLLDTYGHHCPTHLRAAAERMTRRPARRQSGDRVGGTN